MKQEIRNEDCEALVSQQPNLIVPIVGPADALYGYDENGNPIKPDKTDREIHQNLLAQSKITGRCDIHTEPAEKILSKLWGIEKSALPDLSRAIEIKNQQDKYGNEPWHANTKKITILKPLIPLTLTGTLSKRDILGLTRQQILEWLNIPAVIHGVKQTSPEPIEADIESLQDLQEEKERLIRPLQQTISETEKDWAVTKNRYYARLSGLSSGEFRKLQRNKDKIITDCNKEISAIRQKKRKKPVADKPTITYLSTPIDRMLIEMYLAEPCELADEALTRFENEIILRVYKVMPDDPAFSNLPDILTRHPNFLLPDKPEDPEAGATEQDIRAGNRSIIITRGASEGVGVSIHSGGTRNDKQRTLESFDHTEYESGSNTTNPANESDEPESSDDYMD